MAHSFLPVCSPLAFQDAGPRLLPNDPWLLWLWLLRLLEERASEAKEEKVEAIIDWSDESAGIPGLNYT